MNSNKLVYLDNAATSLKTDAFIQKLCESYESNDWFENRFKQLDSLLSQLSFYLSVELSQITIVPSSSYAINEIWSFILGKSQKQELNIYISKEEHISNLSSIIHHSSRDKNVKIKHFSVEDLKNISLKENDLILLTPIDNLGLSCLSIEEIKELRERASKAIFIGDLTQYMPYSSEGEEIYRLFDFFYFSAHKFFGSFGLGVIVSKDIDFSKKIKFRLNYQLDWRSIYVWSETFSEIISDKKKHKEKEKILRRYWIENFPKLPSFSYLASDKSLIFLVGLESEYLHDFVFLLESRKIVFRAYDFCSYNPKSKDKQMRFSLSFLNTIEDIDKLFETMKFFGSLKF